MRLIIYFVVLLSILDINAQINQLDSLNRKHGLWVKTIEGSNKLEYKGNFENGIPVGQFRYYYPTGEVRCIIEHMNRIEAYVTFYFTNTDVMSEGFYRNQLRDSLWLTYDIEGATVVAERFKNGKLDGKRVVFYLRDQIENGLLNVLSETNYNEGVKEGVYIALFSSGKLKEKGAYHLDKKQGSWKTYHADGYLDHISRFKNGMKHGWFEFYNAEGIIIDSALYQNDNRLNQEQANRFLQHCEKKGLDPND
tara:strand:+ start:5638 stop:6390 length:753 start_codon:yes stop_codon:yes gene_type:complete